MATEGAELKAEIGNARVVFGRTAKDRRDRDREERLRGRRWNRKICRRSGSMTDLKKNDTVLAPPESASHLARTRHSRVLRDLSLITVLYTSPVCPNMADRTRRDRQAKSDKFAALRLARQGGRREWKVCGDHIRVGSRRLHATNSSFAVPREKRQKYMMRLQRTNTRASSRVV